MPTSSWTMADYNVSATCTATENLSMLKNLLNICAIISMYIPSLGQADPSEFHLCMQDGMQSVVSSFIALIPQAILGLGRHIQQGVTALMQSAT
jgi:hypothetical protein